MMRDWFDKHQDRLQQALTAATTRAAWSPFVESPSQKHHPEGAAEQGKAAFKARLGQDFPLPDHPGLADFFGEEISPYTGEPLGIRYPIASVTELIEAVRGAWRRLNQTTLEERTGLCLEILDRMAARSFENAHATMHTAGQSFVMAFAGSGANSLDRGLEAITYAYRAQVDVPAESLYTRAFGKGPPVTLQKRTVTRPLGVAAVITCASYPAFNAYPAIFANLMVGAPVIVKPHPQGTLPMALFVETARQVLVEAGLKPNTIVLAADRSEDPVAKDLCAHDDVRIIDFTGSQAFGQFLETAHPDKQVFTETSGCNAVILESTPDLDATLSAIAHGLCLFSSQMCTAPQNIYIPADGVFEGEVELPYGAVLQRLNNAIDEYLEDAQVAAGVCGALATEFVSDHIETLTEEIVPQSPHCRVMRRSVSYEHPQFPDARTATPLVIEVETDQTDLYRQEHFGPIAFVIKVKNRDRALMRATTDARVKGAISSYLYSTDDEYIAVCEDAFFRAGASLSINLHRQRPINFQGAFSDLHVTGLNPAGNACLTDLAFVTGRFRRVQSRRELPLEEIQ